MAAFLLTWRGTGALDLSQILDQRGQPILFTRSGAGVPVHSSVLQHPFVKRYLSERLLEAVSLDSPVTPVKKTPPLKTESVVIKETLSIKATPVSTPELPSAPVVAVPEPIAMPSITIPEPESVPEPVPNATSPIPESTAVDITTPVVVSSTNDPSTDPVTESVTIKSGVQWKKPRRGSRR